MMKEEWMADRAKLRELMKEHLDWTRQQFIEATGRSEEWVKKWRKRIRAAGFEEDTVLYGLPSTPKRLPTKISSEAEAKVLEIRDYPPNNLKRTPGPKAIQYYLHLNGKVSNNQEPLPHSTSTIWRILDKHHRIYRPPSRQHEPIPRPEPMQSWQIDFKEAGSVPPDPDGKKQHTVEVLNMIDVGTSVLLDNPAHPEYNAETVIGAMAATFAEHGLPAEVTFDRDTRFVGSWNGREFPAAFVRFLSSLGVRVNICPPHRPDLNAFVERYHKTYDRECLKVYRPETVEAVNEVNEKFKYHYNFERPNQAITCQNQPPSKAFPQLPKGRALPDYVDPDAWLYRIDGRYFTRRVAQGGTVKVDKHCYYLHRDLCGQRIVLQVDAKAREFVVKQGQKTLKRLPIKGLHGGILPFDEYLLWIQKEAISEWRRWQQKRVRYG